MPFYARNYGWDYRYVHTWPGKPEVKHGHKHGKARKARFHAKHSP
jgi:hypothetical protein